MKTLLVILSFFLLTLSTPQLLADNGNPKSEKKAQHTQRVAKTSATKSSTASYNLQVKPSKQHKGIYENNISGCRVFEKY